MSVNCQPQDQGWVTLRPVYNLSMPNANSVTLMRAVTSASTSDSLVNTFKIQHIAITLQNTSVRLHFAVSTTTTNSQPSFPHSTAQHVVKLLNTHWKSPILFASELWCFPLASNPLRFSRHCQLWRRSFVFVHRSTRYVGVYTYSDSYTLL
jgi:hypothetical protein